MCFIIFFLVFVGGVYVGSQMTSRIHEGAWTEKEYDEYAEETILSDNTYENIRMLNDYLEYAIQKYCDETGNTNNYSYEIFDSMLHQDTRIEAEYFYTYDLKKDINTQLACNRFVFEVSGIKNSLFIVIDTYRMKIYIYESDSGMIRVTGGNYDIRVDELSDEELGKIVQCDWEDMWEGEYYTFVRNGWEYLTTPSYEDMLINPELYGTVIYSLQRYCQENNIQEEFYFDFEKDLVSSVSIRIFTVKVENDVRKIYMDIDLDRNKVHMYEVE